MAVSHGGAGGRGGRVLLVAGATAAGAAVTFGLVLAFTWIALAATGLGMDDVPTPPYLALNLAASFLAALLGGGVAATLGGALVPAWLLAALFVLLSAGTLTHPAPGQPTWYPVMVALLAVVGAMVGGLGGVRRQRARRLRGDPRRPS